ncbi:hypothetical protein C8Q76DRAFT_851778 [Earliella scabrosa]|nr:hypothetical protein C8Q76DRAFT_851778 [Earliella scabrosa]
MTSSLPDDVIAQLVALSTTIAYSNYVVVAIVAWLVYAWATTFDQEVTLFWKGQVSGATFLFFANRYLPIIYFASGFSGNYALSKEMFVYQAACAVFASHDIQCTVVGLSRGSFILADALVVGITWAATYKTIRSEDLHESVPSFSVLLYRNGIVYFVILSVLNILHLAFSLLSIGPGLQEASLVVPFAEPMISIITSQFLFDLQNVKRRTQHQDLFETDSSSSVLDRVIGPLGSRLDPADFMAPVNIHAADSEETCGARDDLASHKPPVTLVYLPA